jgi:hypothetical protein
MYANRFVSFGAAIIVTALQWEAFFSAPANTQSVRAADVAAERDASEDSMPEIVVTAYRQS